MSNSGRLSFLHLNRRTAAMLITAAALAAATVAGYGPSPERQALAGLLAGAVVFLLVRAAASSARRAADRAR